ncbi:hypothetical protein RI367_006002 [Sorochytrium milnesiophthora]
MVTDRSAARAARRRIIDSDDSSDDDGVEHAVADVGESSINRRNDFDDNHGHVSMDVDQLNEQDAAIGADFRLLQSQSKDLFATLRDLGPTTSRKLWQPHFQKCFDIFTKLWSMQQKHRFVLEKPSVYGLVRSEVGEIASRIAQLYYHYYLRTSETNYLLESSVFYEAIRSRQYFKEAVPGTDLSLATRQLRYLGRFTVVGLLLASSGDLVRDLIEQMKQQIRLLQDMGRESGAHRVVNEWSQVVHELGTFIEHETSLPIDTSTYTALSLDLRSTRQAFRVRSKEASRNVSIHTVLITSNNSQQVRFSDLTLDMFRVFQSVEFKAGEAASPESTRNQSRNPFKFLLYQPNFPQMVTHLANCTKDFGHRHGLLLYLSGTGCACSPSMATQAAAELYSGGIALSPRHESQQDASHEVAADCLHPADILPFTRYPMFIVVDSDTSWLYKTMHKLFLAPLVILVSPSKNATTHIDHDKLGSLFTLFLTSPLWAICVLCNVDRVTSQSEWARCKKLITACEDHIAKTLVRDATNIPDDIERFLHNAVAQTLLCRYIMCLWTLKHHAAYSRHTDEEFYPACQPALPDDVLQLCDAGGYLMEVVQCLDLAQSPTLTTPMTPGTLARPPNESAEERRQHRRNLNLVLTIVRHGETDMGARPRMLQGQFNAPLNDKGRKQSLALVHRLQKTQFDHIYCSDLARAEETAQFLKVRRPSVPFTTDARLREQDVGDLSQKPWGTVKKHLKSLDLTMEEYLESHPPAETMATFEQRVVHMYSDIVEKHLLVPNRIPVARTEENLLEVLPMPPSPVTPVSNFSFDVLRRQSRTAADGTPIKPAKKETRTYHILIVTHGGVIQRLLKHVVEELGFNVFDGKRIGYPRHTGVYQLRISKVWHADGDYDWIGSVERINCVSHLAGLRNFVLLKPTKADIKQAEKDKKKREKHDGSRSPTTSTNNVRENKPDLSFGMTLQRVTRKTQPPVEGGGSTWNSRRRSTSQNSLVSKKSAGIKFFGSFLQQYQSSQTQQQQQPFTGPSPKPEEKRSRSLGW